MTSVFNMLWVIYGKIRIPLSQTRELIKSDKVENESQEYKCESKPLGELCQLRIQSLRLALAEESIGTAGNCTGETGALTTLHENDDHDGQTGENLKNGEDNGESRHLFQSFRFYTNSQLVEYNTRIITIQVLS